MTGIIPTQPSREQPNYQTSPFTRLREIEAMFLRQSQMVAQSVRRIMTGLSRCIQRERPGRSYKRESRQPRSKWQKRTAA